MSKIIKKVTHTYNFSIVKEFKNFTTLDWLIIISLIIMFSPTFYRLVTLGWKSADYTHAYFVLPITLWLIYRKKESLVKSDGINTSGIALFTAGIAFYLYAVLNAFMFLEAFSFVLIMWAIFRLRLTQDSFKNILFPLTYLLLLIPPPGLAIDTATFPLKKMSTYGSYFFLKIAHFPVEVYGAILKVGDQELFITDACSGSRSLVTLLALGAVYAYLQNTFLKKKWIIFLSVIPLAIMGNILRITVTAFIVHFAGMKYAEGFFHSFSGILLFLFAILGLYGVTSLICKKKL